MGVMSNQTNYLYIFGHFQLDESRHSLQKSDGTNVPLRPQAFDILLALVKNHGHLVSKEMMKNIAWKRINAPVNASITQCMTAIRRALDDDAKDPKYIETVSTLGYKFKKTVETVPYQDIAQGGISNNHIIGGDFKQPYNIEGESSDSKTKTCPFPENSERIWKLFFPDSGAIELYPADDHPLKDIPKGHLTYPNEERAMQAIRNLLREAKQVVEEKYPSNPANYLVCIGSSVSHIESRTILGDPQDNESFNYKARFIYIGSDYEIDFPYTIVYLSHTVKRLQDGEMRETPNYAIINQKKGSMAIPSWKGKHLVTDILLVTRIPRILGGPDVLIFAGLHGPAIRAVELLLHKMDTSDIDYLEKGVEGSRYFQAVFHITEVGEGENTTVPLKIECDKSKDFRPRRIKVRYRRSSPAKASLLEEEK